MVYIAAGGPRQRRTDHDRHKQRGGTTSAITSGPGKKHHQGMDSLQGNLEPPGTFLDQARLALCAPGPGVRAWAFECQSSGHCSCLKS